MRNAGTHTSLTRPNLTKKRALLGTLALLTSLFAIPAQAATATRSSSFEYDPASGLLVKEIIEPNNSQLCLVTEYTYDAFGNKTSVTTRNCNGSTGEAAAPAAGTDGVIQSRTTSSTFDAKGQFAVSTSNALGHSETRSFDPKFGGVTSLTGPNGLTTNWTYDSFGRKTQESRADGTTTTWAYVVAASPGYSPMPYTAYYISTTDSGNANPTYTFYDALNRKVLVTRRNFADTNFIDDSNIWYDHYGRVAKTYLPYERGQFASAKFSTYSYDLLGRVTSSTAPDNSVTTKTYAGLTTSVTNSLNQTKTTVKNSQGQTVSVTDAQNKTLTYTYDPFGNLTKTIDALGNVTTLSYDLRGRKTGMVDPDMGTWGYAYDALGELIRQIDAKNQTVTMVYDKLGRMTSRTEPDLVSTWTYDTAVKGIGKLASASSDNGYSRTLSYDQYGRLTSTSSIVDNPSTPYVSSTSYDAYGRVDTQTYPTGFAVKNVYNANGYLIQVVNAATPTTIYWQANAVDAAGHLTQQTYGNGVVTQQVYDPATGRMLNQYAGAGNAVQNMAYTYDTLGNVTTRQDTNQNLVETYAYDTLNRITSATATSGAVNVVNTYAYDAIGNITSKSDAGSYIYNASGAGSIRPHAVTGITGTINGVVNPTYSYDANGNMLSGAGRTTTWASFNIPSQIVNCPGGGATCKTAAFWYNPEHERIKELQADQSIVITLSPRYDTGIHWEKRYLSANGTLTGAVEYEHYLYAGGGSAMFGKYITTTTTDGVTIASTSLEYYSKDNLGSIVAITDGAGTVTQRLSYDVWGKRRYPNGTADPNGLLNNPDMYHGFTGHEMLDDVGLVHMNGRLYDPVLARFMSADFMIQAPDNLQSYNRYTYGWNNPLAGTDPSGQIFGIDDIIVWGAIAGAISSGAQSNWDIGAMAKGAVIGGVSAWAGQGAFGAFNGGFWGSVAGGAAGSFTSTFLATGGDWNAAGSSAWSGALSGGLFYGAGEFTKGMNPGEFGKVMAHAVAGCLGSAGAGGSCSSGAMSAGFAEFAGPRISDGWGDGGKLIAHTMVGGLSSALGGGKFADGARTGAFGYLFNEYLHTSQAERIKYMRSMNVNGTDMQNAQFYLSEQVAAGDLGTLHNLVPQTANYDRIRTSFEIQKPGGVWDVLQVDTRKMVFQDAEGIAVDGAKSANASGWLKKVGSMILSTIKFNVRPTPSLSPSQIIQFYSNEVRKQ